MDSISSRTLLPAFRETTHHDSTPRAPNVHGANLSPPQSQALLQQWFDGPEFKSLLVHDKYKDIFRVDWILLARYIVKWYNRKISNCIKTQISEWSQKHIDLFASAFLVSGLSLFTRPLPPNLIPYRPIRWKCGTLNNVDRQIATDGNSTIWVNRLRSEPHADPTLYCTISKGNGWPMFHFTDNDGRVVTPDEFDLIEGVLTEFAVLRFMLHHDETQAKYNVQHNSAWIIFAAHCELYAKYGPEDARTAGAVTDQRNSLITFHELSYILLDMDIRREIIADCKQEFTRLLQEQVQQGKLQLTSMRSSASPMTS